MGNGEYKKIKSIVENKLINKTESRSYEELGKVLFGDKKIFSRKEVVRRMATLKWFIGKIETDDNENTRILSLSDFHIPFQLPIEIFDEYKGKVDVLQLNGDIVDMQSISKFPKTFRINVMDEIINARKYLIELILAIKPKRVVANYGNHEVRFESFLAKHLENDLVGLLPKTPIEMIFDTGFYHYDKKENTRNFYEPLKKIFSKHGIEAEYCDNWFTQIGKTIFCHPLSFRQTPMGTSEKAVNWFRNESFTFDCLVMAHTHRIGSYKIGDTEIFEQGCCCDVKKIQYSNGRFVNSAKEGYVYIVQDKDGNLISDESKLVHLN